MIKRYKADELDINLHDITQFLLLSKKYCLVGMLLGVLISVIYIVSFKPIYQSKITIHLVSNFIFPQIYIGASEVKERLLFETIRNEIINNISPIPSPAEKKALKESIGKLRIIANEKYIELTLLTESAKTSEALIGQLASQIVLKISEWNTEQIHQNSNILNINEHSTINTTNNSTNNHSNLIKLINETLLKNPNFLKPSIINGPTEAIQVNKISILATLIKGLFLGLGLALCISFFYLRRP